MPKVDKLTRCGFCGSTYKLITLYPQSYPLGTSQLNDYLSWIIQKIEPLIKSTTTTPYNTVIMTKTLAFSSIFTIENQI